MENIFGDLETQSDEERIEALLDSPAVRIERIVSHGQSSPPDFWYDQHRDEWVILLRGAAGLAIWGEGERRLSPGDHIFRAGEIDEAVEQLIRTS